MLASEQFVIKKPNAMKRPIYPSMHAQTPSIQEMHGPMYAVYMYVLILATAVWPWAMHAGICTYSQFLI